MDPKEKKRTETVEVWYHGVAQDEDWQLRVAGLHQVNMLQRVSDVKLEILDVHPLPFALTVTHCWEKRKRGRRRRRVMKTTVGKQKYSQFQSKCSSRPSWERMVRLQFESEL